MIIIFKLDEYFTETFQVLHRLVFSSQTFTLPEKPEFTVMIDLYNN